MDDPPVLAFIFNFSPIAVEYSIKQENIFVFLTYILGILGGVLAITKFILNNCLCFYKNKETNENSKIIEM